MQPRIGFCCTYISPSGDEVEQRALNMRQPTVASLVRADGGAARLHEVIRHNLDTLDRQIALVAAYPPVKRLFRIVRNFLVGWSHPAAQHLWSSELRSEVQRRLARSGDLARAGDVRLSMHPAQHAILATVTGSALENALRDIEEHTEIFGMLGYDGGWHPYGASVNIHGGSKSAGIDAVRTNLARLSKAARDLLTIENDEISFGLDDLLPVADETALLVDFHHHWVHSRGEWIAPDDPRLDRVRSSWRGVRPLSHISVSREALLEGYDPDVLPDFASLAETGLGAAKLRGHSDRMWNRAVNRFVERHLKWTDVEVEAKAKNLASADLVDQLAAEAQDA